MMIVNEDDFKAMWQKRYESKRNVSEYERYKLRAKYDFDAEANALINSVEIGGITFKIEE